MRRNQEDGQLSLFAQGSYCGKMSQECFPAEAPKGRTSVSCLRKYAGLQTGPYQYLDLTGENGNLLGPSWEKNSPSLGASWMLNTGPAPRSGGGGCTLRQILEDKSPQKYYLNRKACLGILRRSKERGKPLPQQLEAALRVQAGLMAPPPPVPVQEAETICVNDQGGKRIDFSIGISGTLCTRGHRPVVSVYENHGIDARYTGPHAAAPTVTARYGTGGNNIPLVGQEVFCIAGNVIGRQPQNGGNGLGCQADIAYTLTGMDRHAVFSCQANDTSQPRLIRRLTELECERLQGFPDGWTDIPGASGSARYRALGNSIAVPCAEYALRGIAADLRGSVHYA